MTDVHARPVRSGAIGLLVGLAGLIVALLAAGGIPDAAPAGIPDPGALTNWALPLLGWVSNLLAIGIVAALIIPLLVMHRLEDKVAGQSVRAAKPAVLMAGLWILVIAAEIWFTASDQFAQGIFDLEWAVIRSVALDMPQGQAFLAQMAIVALLALGIRWLRTVRDALFVLCLALVAVVPPLLTGHSASSGSHDAAIAALLLHVLPVVVWVAGVVALWWHLRAETELRERAVRRFSALAAWCFGLTAVSGVASGLLRLSALSELFTEPYGLVVIAKAVVLVGIGLVAQRIRRLLAAGETLNWKTFAVLSAIELSAMSLAIGLGVALSRTPPPVGEPYTSVAESMLGGPLPPAPSVWGMLSSFHVSGLGITVMTLGAVGYIAGLRALRRRGDKWPIGRTISWFLGLLVVGYATVGGLGVWSGVMFSVHMGSHMALSMIAPVLLVLGGPITLALRALPGTDVPGGQGPRQVLLAFLESRWSKVVTHPAFATVMFVGSLYAIYFTSIYDKLMANHLGHTMMELHFLLAGYLYYEVLIGNAPLPKRLPHLGRLALIFVVAPFHAFFAVAVMTTSQVIGGSYYEALDRPYSSDLLADQHLAGGFTWAMGEIPLIMVAIVLLFQWFKADNRRAKQLDRQAARDDGAALREYNEMLARISAGDASRSERDPSTRRRSTSRDAAADTTDDRGDSSDASGSDGGGSGGGGGE